EPELHHRARALFVRAVAGQQLSYTGTRSARRILRYLVPGLRSRDRRRVREALRGAPSLTKERSNSGGERAGKTDHVLPGPRHAGAGALGTARRCTLVEPGVRGGGVSQRVSGGGASGGRRSDGCALQRDPVGASCDARLVVW